MPSAPPDRKPHEPARDDREQVPGQLPPSRIPPPTWKPRSDRIPADVGSRYPRGFTL